MSEDAQERAERLLEAALDEMGARDPREFYRERLRELKESDPSAYETAVRHYREVLVTAIAEDGEDPLEAWMEYGRTLAELRAPGRTVRVDGTGRAREWERPVGTGDLVLHVPRTGREPALLVGLPAELTAAQRATYDWLVAGRQTLRP